MDENMQMPPVGEVEEPKKNNKTLIIIIAVIVVLCCCCIAIGGASWLWNNGDALLYELGIY